MLDKAIGKIKNEMDQNRSNQYIQVVGEFLLQHLQANPGEASKVMKEGKTIGNSLGAMRKVAEGKKVGNYAMLTPQEGFGAVLKFFNFEGEPVVIDPPQNVVNKVEIVRAAEKKNTGFSVSLDDLL